MQEIFSFLKQIPLFSGIAEADFSKMLSCLNARKASYRRQDVILLEGRPVSSVGIVLSGRVQIIREDYAGNRTITAEIPSGNLFAESFCCVRAERIPVTVISASESEILWIDYRRIVSPCTQACPFHAALIENMLSILAQKNIMLNQKIGYLSRHTTREKVLSYLSDRAVRCKSRAFSIPFSRQELADYLCVDRSALSNELSRMQKGGILRFQRNRFELTEPVPAGTRRGGRGGK